MNFYIAVGIVLLVLALLVAIRSLKTQRQQDSPLKRRAIFNLNEQLTFRRLCEVLPDAIILAHVSFDALLTTKYPHTRHKYRHMMADFVVMNRQYQVMAIVALEDASSLKGLQQEHYQDALLQMAGYRVLRYPRVPDYPRLHTDFLQDLQELEQTAVLNEDINRKYSLYPSDKNKILGESRI
ncbi:DUF2726 domain-containing protein [Acinetobacter sp. CAAS 2-6]|uniref:DUF2726 domain-containing protein n=1 Tax=Acinetobacter sp. CAAS 2-6 TaxID=3016358 RepID=UPI002DD6A3D9|nr:DUF2726 domain-containing protein [Acinetobacter sp. CAAS 2-6]